MLLPAHGLHFKCELYLIISMLGLKLIHISKRGHWCIVVVLICYAVVSHTDPGQDEVTYWSRITLVMLFQNLLTLPQIMVYRLFGAEPLPTKMDLLSIRPAKTNLNEIHIYIRRFLSRKSIQNVVCEMSAISFGLNALSLLSPLHRLHIVVAGQWLLSVWFAHYRKVSNIRRTLVGNKIVDHSDVVGASPVGAAPTTSSFST